MRILRTLCVIGWLALTSLANQLAAQTNATSSSDREEGFKARARLTENSYLTGLHATNIGPAIMSGRVVDLAVNRENPGHFYAAYASGGLWVTHNYGNTFEPLFDDQNVLSIGDIAMNWTENILWVGTGENNSSRSSYSGNGIYKSNDGGKSWQHLGLDETHHIGRIILHPDNKDIAWVAALGHLYSANADRGVYKTTDGGKSWIKTLFLNDDTGAIDLLIDPKNGDVLYAAMWERERKAWNFKGNGPSSGIYKSTDGGDTWTKITNGKNGFPADDGVGRIGLAISHQNSGKLYALLDNQNRRSAEEEKHPVNKDLLRSITTDAFAALAEKDINDFLDRHNFPNRYNATDIKAKVKAGKLQPADLVTYLADANAMLFDTPVKGAEVYVSNDGGAHWEKTHQDYIDDLYYSYGYYFGNIRVSPQDDDKLYIMGVPILKSGDGGANWENINGDNVHADHHALWVSPTLDGLLINGNDGGVNISFDDGASWTKQNNIPVGQFYSVNVDNAKPYHVYGGLQDNGVWDGPSNYAYSKSWTARGQYPYKSLYGGDGMQVVIDTRDNNTVYTGFQFGYYARINKQTGERKSIKPTHSLGETPLRFNWQSPIHLSVHNQDVVYFGSNKFHRSLDQGDNWDLNSDDLTKGGKKGNVPYGTLTTIDESPLQFGLLYVGTDDGLVHVSRDGGNTWENISAGLEPEQWVSRVEASNFSKGRVYVALNGYRWDRFDAMVYVSEDNGKSWQRIGLDLPAEPVNVIREDPVNENLLYVGTDHGIYVSLDRGATFMLMDENLPRVPVHDLVVHEQAHDLLAGTHGRSIFKADVAELQQMTADILNKTVHVFTVDPITYNDRWGETRWSRWSGLFEPSVTIPVFVNKGGSGVLKVYAGNGSLMKEQPVDLSKGLNYVEYDLTIDRPLIAAYKKVLKKSKTNFGKKLDSKANGSVYLLKGDYKIEFSLNGGVANGELTVQAPKEKPGRKPQKKIP
jgi:photosystem II stability/assembly factor-like uncharacterized protein